MQLFKNPVFIAILGCIIIGLAIAMNMSLWDDSADMPNATETQQQVAEQSTQVTVEEASSTEDAQVEKSVAAIKPSFDVVRIAKDGNAVIAGRATPGTTVEILDGDTIIGSVLADVNGEWVFVTPTPLLPGNRQLSLRMTNSDGSTLISEQVVVVVIPDPNSDDEPFAVATSRDNAGSVTVLQKPTSAVTESTSGTMQDALSTPLSIDAVDYGVDGQFTISGTAPTGSTVNNYLDNTYIGTSVAENANKWVLLPETMVKPGQYKLRADRVDEKGEVLERVTIPFMRDEMTEELGPGAVYVVQPGNSLWRIARNTYGDGMQYTLIFQANDDQIGNPDMIFPGQIFQIPKSSN